MVAILKKWKLRWQKKPEQELASNDIMSSIGSPVAEPSAEMTRQMLQFLRNPVLMQQMDDLLGKVGLGEYVLPLYRNAAAEIREEDVHLLAKLLNKPEQNHVFSEDEIRRALIHYRVASSAQSVAEQARVFRDSGTSSSPIGGR